MLNTQSFSDDQGFWVHWTGTYEAFSGSGSGFRAIYRNGQLVASDHAPSDYNGAAAIIVGTGGDYGATSFGEIDEFQFYHGRALTASEVNSLLQDPTVVFSNLQLRYDFDHPVVNLDISQSDLSPIGTRGVLTGNAAFLTLCPSDAAATAGGGCATLPSSCAPGFNGTGGPCAPCPVGTFRAASGRRAAACAPCPSGQHSFGVNGPSTCAPLDAWYRADQVPAGPGRSGCDLPLMAWQNVTAEEGGANSSVWTGGLGLLMQPYAMVWVCLRRGFGGAGGPRDCPEPPDLACYVYNELIQEFVYWGRNSLLRVVPLT